jgi:8-oxo-dGTP diphosphatase
MPRDVHVVAAVIRRGQFILATKRLPGGTAGGKWEFPGGKIEPGESPEEALVREIDEELGVELVVGDLIGAFVSDEEAIRLHLHCYWCTAAAGEPQLRAHSALQWCMPGELCELDWAVADVPAVKAILACA